MLQTPLDAALGLAVVEVVEPTVAVLVDVIVDDELGEPVVEAALTQ